MGNDGIPKGGFKEIRKGAELRTQRNVESRELVEQICSKLSGLGLKKNNNRKEMQLNRWKIAIFAKRNCIRTI